MNKLGIIAIGAVIILMAGAIVYLSLGMHPVAGLSDANKSAAVTKTNTTGTYVENATIAKALASCAKAGISASQCQSYCLGNPATCGLSGVSNASSGFTTHGNLSSAGSNQTSSPYVKVYVGKNVNISQFTIKLDSIQYNGSTPFAMMNVSQGHYSREIDIGQMQYSGFGSSGGAPYLVVSQINANGTQKWAALNIVFSLASGFSAAVSMGGNVSAGYGSNSLGHSGNATGNQISQSSIAYMLQACQNQTYLTSFPTNLSSILNITPLGSLNPAGGHPIPSDHGGFSLVNPHAVPATVYAPGNVHVLQIVAQNSTLNGQTFHDDAIYFAPCQQLVFYYGHIAHLSSALQQEISNSSKTANCQHVVQGESTSNTCTYNFDYMASSGEILGSAGGPGTTILGFDFGGYDLRKDTNSFIDPTREFNDFGRPVNTIYPLDYYSASMQGVLYPKVVDTLKGSNGYPSEWTDMQDVAGTIQGNWYANTSLASGQPEWAQQMSIVHYNLNPSIGVLSIGGTLAQAGMITFNPQSSGYLNREPSQVTSDGHIYCYYQDNTNTTYGLSPLSGHFVLQLIDSNTLKIEYQNGSCPQNPAFANSTTYIR